MNKQVTITVTQTDIKKADEHRRENNRWKPGMGDPYVPSKYCPIARAVKRQFPKRAEDVGVGLSAIKLRPLSIPLPSKARRFIELFDGKHQVQPFQFTIEVPEELAP